MGLIPKSELAALEFKESQVNVFIFNHPSMVGATDKGNISPYYS